MTLPAEGPAKPVPPLEVRQCRCRALFKVPYWSDRYRCDDCWVKGRNAD